jgi:hypothetical protein
LYNIYGNFVKEANLHITDGNCSPPKKSTAIYVKPILLAHERQREFPLEKTLDRWSVMSDNGISGVK